MKHLKITPHWIAAFIAGICVAVVAIVIILHQGIPQRFQNKVREWNNNPPFETDVCLDSTSLPIVFISVNHIHRDKKTRGYMRIIHNGMNSLNFGDTTLHTNQKVVFEGGISVKYRGHASFYNADKKSYTIETLSPEGDATKRKLLGMRKGKKWALLGQYIDRSMIRECLAYELARPYMDYVPEEQFCEVMLNGVYQGVYMLSEMPSSSRLHLKSKGAKKGDGAYLMYFSRQNEADYNICTPFVSATGEKDTLTFSFKMKYPSRKNITATDEAYLSRRLQALNEALIDTASDGYKQQIEVQSFIDYQLSTEFAKNTDGYWCSAYMYQMPYGTDSLFRMTLWDVDHSFGMTKVLDYCRYDQWVYEARNPQSQARWWQSLNARPEYQELVSARWRQYRTEAYSDEHIAHVMDSLTTLLTKTGAIERNNKAWKIWTSQGSDPILYHVKYLSDSYDDEIRYIRDYIQHRLRWMDGQLNP